VASVVARQQPAWRAAATVAARVARDRRDILVVVLLTAIAFALRVRGFGEGLGNDELLTLDNTQGRGLLGVLDVVANGPDDEPLEKNPPLFFVLAWAGTHLGDPLSWIRLPSLVLGTATVPLVFLLGRRTVGPAAALVGAGFIALSPFAVYYGIEARAYGTLLFLSALSVLVLLTALESARARWWVAYAAAVAAVLYTHYTGVAVIAAQGAWALWCWRARWRGLLAAYAGAAAAFAPWLPYVQSSPDHFGPMARLVRIDHWDAFLQWVAGSPEARLSRLPGTPALMLLGCALAVALVTRLLAARPRGPAAAPQAGHHARERVLVLVLALAGPVFSLLYGVVSDDLFLFPRNMSASLPFAALALGWALTRPPAPWTAATVVLAAAGIGLGAAQTLRKEAHRPDFPGVARLLDERAGPRDLVLLHGAGLDPFILGWTIARYFERPHPRDGADVREASLTRAFDRRRGKGRVFVVELETRTPVQPPSVAGWEAVGHQRLPGLRALTVVAYEELRPRGRALAGGRLLRAGRVPVRVAPGALRGVVDTSTASARAVTLTGWAATAQQRPVDQVLVFAGDRLAAAGVPTLRRPDVSSSAPDELGFELALPSELARRRRGPIRVVATAGDVAAPVPFGCHPGVPQVLGCSASPAGAARQEPAFPVCDHGSAWTSCGPAG
jgi:hypothetical protein